MEMVWALITEVGLPEGWAAISLGMVITYFIMKYTKWKEPSVHRKKFKTLTVMLALTLILAFVAVRGVKVTAQVPRPCMVCDGDNEPPGCNPHCIDDDFSFPSGHAATIFAVATVGLLLIRRKEGLALYVPAAVIAYSRFALGIHTMADVAGGSVVGVGSAVVVWWALGRRGFLAGLST